MYRLSLLDKSPIAEKETAADALARTLPLAQQAENLGLSPLLDCRTPQHSPACQPLAGAADCLDPGANTRAFALAPAA